MGQRGRGGDASGLGVVDQLRADAASGGPQRSRGTEGAGRKRSDPVAVGAQLVADLGDLQVDDRTVIVVVEDLHWSDRLSAQALLFALRRMRTDRVLGLVSTRPGEMTRLGEGWSRFVGGDPRVTRLLMNGLSPEDLVNLARSLGAGDLSSRAVARLVEHTGGNALHSRALLEELGQEGLARAADDLPAPRALASVVETRLKLSIPRFRKVCHPCPT